jgi:arylformamidase
VINLTKILLSYYIDNDSPYYVGTTKPRITPNNQIETGDDYNTYIINVFNHIGTHVDAPKHFISKGKRISEYDINDLFFKKPLILECNKDSRELVTVEDISKNNLEGYDCILIKTGFGRYRKKDLNKYLTENPGVSYELIHWLRENHQNIKCIGIDCISIARYNDDKNAKKTHITAFTDNKFYGEPLLLIEDMDLGELNHESRIIDMIIVPWQINGIDSAPCTIIADIK